MFVNKPKFILLHKVKWFQVLPCITNNSIKQSFIYTQLNDQTVLFVTIEFSMSTKLNSFKYCYVSANNSIKQSFVYTQLNDQTVLFLTIQFSMSTKLVSSIAMYRQQFN